MLFRSQLFIKRLERNEELIKQMEDEVRKFQSDLDKMIERLNEVKNGVR